MALKRNRPAANREAASCCLSSIHSLALPTNIQTFCRNLWSRHCSWCTNPQICRGTTTQSSNYTHFRPQTLVGTALLHQHFATAAMARRSQRLSETTKAPGKHKRAASGSNLSGANSKRTRKSSQASRTTPTKSQYFQDDDDEHHGVQGDAAATSSASAETSGSDFDQEPADSDQTPEPDVDESDSEPEKKRTSSKGRKAVTVFREKDADGWRPGASTGLEPGVELVFKKRKPRPAGKIPYTDHTIHPNTLLFLKELKANNKREWLKSEYHISFESFRI